MRPMRALAYAVGLCVAFCLPRLFLAVQMGFDIVAPVLVLSAFGLLIWIALMRPIFGRPLVALRTMRVLRVVIATRLPGALAPCGCADLLSGALVARAVSSIDLAEGGPSSILASEFVVATLLTLGQGTILLIEFLLMAGVIAWVECKCAVEHNADICLTCGYDIRASREIGRCPECGTACSPPLFRAPVAPASLFGHVRHGSKEGAR